MIEKFAVAVKYGCHWLLYTDNEGSQEFDKSGAETLAKQLRSEVRPNGTMIASGVRVVQIAIVVMAAFVAIADAQAGDWCANLCHVVQHHAAPVVVKQVVAYPHYQQHAYYAPVGQYPNAVQYQQAQGLIDELRALKEEIARDRESRNPALKQSIVLTRCGKCHGDASTNAKARELWQVPAVWTGDDIATALDAALNHGMAEKAGLTADPKLMAEFLKELPTLKEKP